MLEQLMTVSADHLGVLVWIIWGLIGLYGALVSKRLFGGRRIFLFDLIVGVIAAELGGYLSTRFLGDTPMQLFLLSLLGAVFGAGLILWLTGTLVTHFSNNE